MRKKSISMRQENCLRVQGGSFIYDSKAVQDKILPGVYQMNIVNTGFDYKMGFAPINPDNDEPLDIDPELRNYMKEIDNFMSKREKYAKLGFAHKRGYLFYGGPGEGKSTKVRLLEKKFVERYQGIVLLWNNCSPVEHYKLLREMLGDDVPIMIVCEDMEQYLGKFEAYILEFLDGQEALHNLILVCTTNYIDKIPERIKYRPSRIDRVIEVKAPTEAITRNYLEGIGIPIDKIDAIVAACGGLSLAMVKEVVISHFLLEYSLADSIKLLHRAEPAAIVPAKGSDKPKDSDEEDEDDEEDDEEDTEDLPVKVARG